MAPAPGSAPGAIALVGIYADQIVPRIVNVTCGTKAIEHLRVRTCSVLRGEVIEIGFGTGHNVPFYPDAVAKVHAVEPAELGWRLAQERVGASKVAVERSGLDGQSLPFPDDTFDSALSTWTLCTIPDAATALGELRRVLKPDGVLSFVEHGLSPEEGVRRWQHRLEPIQKRVSGGCHLTRKPETMISAAGFRIDQIDNFYEDGTPRPFGYLSLGTATPL